MKRFVRKCALAVFLVGCVYLLSGFVFCKKIGNQYSTGYPGALIDKIDRIQSIDEPKIVLVGDSNVAFGLRSKMIEDHFGMPVVNLGMQHDLGNSFNERLALLNLHEGDIVILCNLDFDGDDRFISKELAWSYFEWNPQVWKTATLMDYWDLGRAYPTYLHDAYSRYRDGRTYEELDSAYSRFYFNEYGDNVYSVDHYMCYVTEASDMAAQAEQPASKASIKRINKMNDTVVNAGATLLIAGKPLVKPDNDTDLQTLINNCQIYDGKISEVMNCAVISSSANYIYDASLFYDVYPHLNNEGAAVRTSQLINDLDAYFALSVLE